MLYLFAILLYLQVIESFNIDTKSPFIYLNPLSKKNSFFGYSLQLYPEHGMRSAGIFIGAPKGSYKNSSNFSGGVLLQCPIQQQCKEIFIEQDLNNAGTTSTKNFWLGGSIDINYYYDKLVTCAHRSTTSNKMYGDCYWFHIAENNKHKTEKLRTDKIQKLIEMNEERRYNNSYHSQVGTSLHFVRQNKPDVLILGAPGLHNWRGQNIRFKSEEKNNDFDSNCVVGGYLFDTTDFSFGLIGYSVSSGRFYADKQILYVTGGPKTKIYLGYIIIYKYIGRSNPKKRLVDALKGEQFGEYFGSSLTVGDVNNDGFDDLIVGAPFYTNSTFNEGRVYVFLGGKTQLEPAPIAGTISGIATNGQFGTTVQFLGDLNRDGFGDVAIAAPYELENSGVVYIFEGSEYGLNPQFTQRIVGREVFSEIRGFGISISRAVDIDNNNYLDLAIGAHLSEHVVVLQTSPVVQVFHFLDFNGNETHIKENATDFQIQICFYAISNELEPINITRHLEIDEGHERVQLKNGQLSELITITPQLKSPRFIYCQNLAVTLKKSVENSNRYIPIRISLWHTFEQIPRKNKIVFIDPQNQTIETSHFCVRCAVYDEKRSSKRVSKLFPFSLRCSNKNICISHLELTQEMNNIINGNFILGSSDSLTLNITVNNSGEHAYQAYILLSKTETIKLKKNLQICEENNSTSIQCTFNEPITANREETVSLEFDMSEINGPHFSAEKPFYFESTIFTSSNNSNPNRTKILQVTAITEADVKITGKSAEDTYSYGKITKGKPDFSQFFEIEKFGPSPIGLLAIDITIPHSIKSKHNPNNTIQFIDIRQHIGKLEKGKFLCGNDLLSLTNSTSNENTENSTEFEEETTLSRNKRQTMGNLNKANNEDKDKFKANNTLLISCNDENIICMKIKCTAGPFKTRKNVGLVKIQMMADINLIKNHFGKQYNNLIIRSNASVRILNPTNVKQSGNESDFAQVSTHFIGDKKPPKVLLILIISVVIGILLLLLLILGLIKAGFFKRSTKEKLLELKQKIEDEENLNEVNQSEEIIQPHPDERDEEQLQFQQIPIV